MYNNCTGNQCGQVCWNMPRSDFKRPMLTVSRNKHAQPLLKIVCIGVCKLPLHCYPLLLKSLSVFLHVGLPTSASFSFEADKQSVHLLATRIIHTLTTRETYDQ